MIFWDSSALVPLLVDQPGMETLRALPFAGRVVWWGTRVECASALARLEREGVFGSSEASTLRAELTKTLGAAVEVRPVERVRERAERLLRLHALRAADALQLAAALVFCRDRPSGTEFVCLDERLRTAAASEGFTILP